MPALQVTTSEAPLIAAIADHEPHKPAIAVNPIAADDGQTTETLAG